MKHYRFQGLPKFRKFCWRHAPCGKACADTVYRVFVCCICRLLVMKMTLCDVVSPAVPQLDTDTAEGHMREGGTVVWTCTSTGGNPAPSMTWYRNGSPVNSSWSTLTPAAVKFGATVSRLTWTLTATDHWANFSCSASTAVISGSRVYSPVARYRVQCKYLDTHIEERH